MTLSACGSGLGRGALVRMRARPKILLATTYEEAWELFERYRLELHPENPAPYDVLLGRSGADRRAIYDTARALEGKGLLRMLSVTNRHNKGRVFKFVIPEGVFDPLSI